MKICPKCHKSFPDGVKLCPFDRIAMVAEGDVEPSGPGQVQSTQSQNAMPNASELAALDILPDGPGRLLFETLAFYHAPIQGLLVFGGGLIFMVIASLTGMRTKGGSAPPTMSGETASMLVVVGILALATGFALQHFFRHYTVFDFRRSLVSRQARAFGKVIWEGSLIRQDQVVAIGTTTRPAGISAENLKMIFIKNFTKDTNRGLPNDVSLVMLGKDAKMLEITAFRNGTRHDQLASARASLLARHMNLPCKLCNQGEMLEVSRKHGQPLSFHPVSQSEIAKKPENIANKILVWVIILIVLIGGWFALMIASGVWKH
ncbi:MAG: hypothetical protein KKB51_15680 [Candidatus Riflebacteria bacterium]|nr:hypothetical protein [Candidatus Riflebacteria bacterium]